MVFLGPFKPQQKRGSHALSFPVLRHLNPSFRRLCGRGDHGAGATLLLRAHRIDVRRPAGSDGDLRRSFARACASYHCEPFVERVADNDAPYALRISEYAKRTSSDELPDS